MTDEGFAELAATMRRVVVAASMGDEAAYHDEWCNALDALGEETHLMPALYWGLARLIDETIAPGAATAEASFTIFRNGGAVPVDEAPPGLALAGQLLMCAHNDDKDTAWALMAAAVLASDGEAGALYEAGEILAHHAGELMAAGLMNRLVN